MSEKYKILSSFIKDMSSETPNIETYLFVKKNIAKYQLNIDITSKPLKDKLVEVSTTLKYEDKNSDNKKSFFEIIFSTVIKVSDEIKEKKDMEKIILIDVPSKIYPELRRIFVSLFEGSGFKDIKINETVDFEKLYKMKKAQ